MKLGITAGEAGFGAEIFAKSPVKNWRNDLLCGKLTQHFCSKTSNSKDKFMATIQELFDLTGKVALVTGGSRGLGQEMAEGLAEAGASLMLVARREQWLTPTVEEFIGRGFPCEGVLCDVSNPEQVQNAVNKTVEAFGKVDILINNAGVAWGSPAEDLAVDKWKMVIDIDLTGAFLFSQAAGREMIKQKYGRIINVASIAGIIATMPDVQQTSAYNAAKGGLLSLTRALSAEWAQHNIRVNAICPGFFSSRMADKVIEVAGESIKSASPMGRIGNPGELKGVAVFLAADASNYMTGQSIVVDGGTTIV
jgi:NAD(P)-dependent dehydrogenase (short-subunit alcohol dehydrogenase family)